MSTIQPRSSAINVRKHVAFRSQLAKKILLLFFTAFSIAATAQVQQLQPAAMRQIQSLMLEKESRTPAQKKISSDVLYAFKMRQGLRITSEVATLETDVVPGADGKVKVDMEAEVTPALLNTLKAMGAEIVYSNARFKDVLINVPLDKIEEIASLDAVKHIVKWYPAQITGNTHTAADNTAVRRPGLVDPSGKKSDVPVFNPKKRPDFKTRAANVRKQVMAALQSNPLMGTPLSSTKAFAGAVTSEGDVTHKADQARSFFGVNGSGIKIGVLSNGVAGYATSVASGDLPPFTIMPGQEGSGSEGSAMMEIIHDLAPGAQLYFATANPTMAAMAQNILDLRAAGCDIIVDDVIYFAEGVFQDDIIAQAVNTITASGGMYFSSASNGGNLNDNTANSWEGDFVDGGSLSTISTGTVHNFGTSLFNASKTSTTITVRLAWSDPLGGSGNDYDLFILNASGATVVRSSTNVQDGNDNPIEQTTVQGVGQRIYIVKKPGAATRALHLEAFGNGIATLTLFTQGGTSGHSAAINAFSVAATPAAGANGPYPGIFTTANTVETFSSDGPRRMFYTPDGNPITPGNLLFGSNGGTVLQKPDITAADRVATNTVGFQPFSGTSAAAPHAAAIAALMKSKLPSITPAQVRTALISSAIDIEAPGVDRDAGAGIIMPYEAMLAAGATQGSNIDLGTVTASEGATSNGNGFIEPGEQGSLTVQLLNLSGITATGVNAVLSTNTPGVTITQGTASYGDIAANGSATNNAAPFLFGVSSSVACGDIINFTLTVTFGGGSAGASPKTFTIPVKVGTGYSIAATFGTAPAAGTGYAVATGTQTNRVSRSGQAATCNLPKTFPGITTTTGSPRYQAYTFINSGASSRCVAVRLFTTAAANAALFVVVYDKNGFVPTSVGTNYLSDQGQSASEQSQSFNAPAGEAFTVVVSEINPNAAVSNAAYTLSVDLPKCSVIASCPPVVIQTASIATGIVNTPYSQSFSATGGTGNYSYSVTGTLPNGLTLAGNTLSGTPTQRGVFPITVTAADLAGCPAGMKSYDLTINCQVITVSNPSSNAVGVNAVFSQSFTQTNGVGTVTFSTTSTLPSGITLSPEGLLSGSTSEAGSYPITVTATDANGCTGTNSAYTLTVGGCTPLTGTYTVGTGGNYPSLTNAGGIFEALNNCGASGNITINIISDLTGETGSTKLNELAAGITVLIKPSGGARTITGSSASAVLAFNGADNVTIDGSLSGATAGNMAGGDASIRNLTIQNILSSTVSGVVVIQTGNNGAQHNTIKNVNIAGLSPTETLLGIAIGGNTTGSAGADNDDNRIENCSVRKALFGIYNAGITATNPNTANVITKNDLTGTGTDRLRRVGILVFNHDGLDISLNSISGIVGDEAADCIGIGAGIQAVTTTTVVATGAVTNTTISRNKISGVTSTNSTGFSVAGIAIAGGTGSNTISNNMISEVIAPSTSPDLVAGIYVTGVTGSSTRVLYNTVFLSGDRGAIANQIGSYGIAITGTDPTVELKNNIFHTTQTSGGGANAKSYALGTMSATFANLSSDYNDFFFSGANAAGFRSGGLGTTGTDYATLAAWRTATAKDANSKNVAPVFAGSTDLHLTAANTALAHAGTPIAGLTIDFDGDTRNATTPDIGADEFSVPLPALSVNDVSINEGNAGPTSFTFTVNLSSPALAGGVSFNYATGDNTATTADNDYTATNGTRLIQAGDQSLTITVLVNGDTKVENDETFFVNITNVANATVAKAQGTGTIKNDDALTPTITVNTSLTPFTACAGTASAEQTFTVDGANLTANLVVNAPAGFEISETTGTGFGSSVSFTPASGTVTTKTVYVRMTATATGTPSGTITANSNGATTQNISVSGTVNAIPAKPTITPAGSVALCAGESVQLSSSSATGNQWYKDGGPIASATLQQYTANATGTYTVIVTTSGCPSPASDGTMVTVNALPVVTTPTVTQPTCDVKTGTIVVNATGTGALEYSINGGSSWSNNQTFSGLIPGNYNLTARLQGTTCATSYSSNPVTLTAATGCICESPVTQPYIASTNTGNQNFRGELGLEFTVNAPVSVKQLGAFDDKGDGIKGLQPGNGVRVAIYSLTTHSIVTGLDATVVGLADAYTGNHRMKNIAPVTLQPGNYMIVAKGYNINEQNGNLGNGGGPYPEGDRGANNAISFLGEAAYGPDDPNGFNYPTVAGNFGSNHQFLAGSFTFTTSGPCATATADLTNLVLTPPAALSPAFTSGTTAYTANVANNIASVTVTPTASDPAAGITVNGQPVTSGNASQAIPLVEGSNNITVIVTAVGSATTKTYTITVIKAASGQCTAPVAQAYSSNTSAGAQGYRGELGMEFIVNNANGIIISQLGAFDDGGNGITGLQSGGVRVAIFNRATHQQVAGLNTVISGTAGTLSGNHRMVDISPITLPAGDYVIVAKGYNLNERNGNTLAGTPAQPTGNNGGGAISFGGNSSYGPDDASGFNYPSTEGNFGTTQVFLAGTFNFTTVIPCGGNTTCESAPAVAYVSNTNMGSQPYQGELGMQFIVNNPAGINIKQLGAFDDGGNGITGTQSGGVRVVVFNRSTQKIVPGLDVVISGNADAYTSFHRMKNITPVLLPMGDYTLVAKGYNVNERNGNIFSGGGPFPAGDNANGAITFGAETLYGPDDANGFNYPTNTGNFGDTHVFLAGTFNFTSNVSCPSSGASEASGASVITSAAGAPAVAADESSEGKTIKVYPNPSRGQFKLQLSNVTAPKLTIDIINTSGQLVAQKTVAVLTKTALLNIEFNMLNQVPGIYMIKVQSSDGVKTEKLVIQR